MKRWHYPDWCHHECRAGRAILAKLAAAPSRPADVPKIEAISGLALYPTIALHLVSGSGGD